MDFFCYSQLPMALKSLIYYPQFYALQKYGLRKPILPQRVYECIAHHTHRRKTLYKRISEPEKGILPAATCHPVATNTSVIILPLKKKNSDLQLRRYISEMDCLGAGCCLAMQNEMAISPFSTSVSFTKVLESNTFQQG